MKNLAEQKRVFTSVVGVLISWIVFAILFFTLFFFGLFPNQSIAGYAGANYLGDDQSGKIEKGDFLLCKAFNYESAPLEAEKIGVFYTYQRNGLDEVVGKELKVKVIESSFINSDHNLFCIYFHDLDGETTQYCEVPAQNIVGTYVFSVPYLGYAGNALTTFKYAGWIMAIILAFLLVVLPVFGLAKRVKTYRRISPFAEGINQSKLSPEMLYVYQKIMSFLYKSGKMQFKKGYDCEIVYANRKPFCKIRYYDKAIYILINKDFTTRDNRIDRNGYIRIDHPTQLNEAKERIFECYQNGFKRKKKVNGVKYYRGLPPVEY